MKKLWFVLTIACLLVSFDDLQVRQITGTVKSASDGSPIPGVSVTLKGTQKGTATDLHGRYRIEVPASGGALVFSFAGYKTREIPVKNKNVIDIVLEVEVSQLTEVIVEQAPGNKRSKDERHGAVSKSVDIYNFPTPQPEVNIEEYEGINENIFREALKDPLSTFSIDVDRASYSNVRRFINNGQRPPADAVRIEELVNYFAYEYPQPADEHPFTVNTEISEAPWNSKHKLIQIGLQGKIIPTNNLPASNLVFLIDVSGSMNQPNKLPLVKQSFAMLTDQLRSQDRVSIVVYAGAAGAVLEPTPGSEKKKILAALDRLQAGGSTAGGEGLRLAYSLAMDNFLEGGNNRVIIATDGDFNVGESSNDAMEKLITDKRKDGIFLTVLGYGMGNYKDSKLEILADKGNGNYAYIDNLTEARKTLVSEFGGTLFTIATDVKLQLEFNPAKVKAYRLIGYENRLLKSEDFNNDRKDAGELGSGHTVTALYEVIPVGVKSDFFDIDPLKYREQGIPDKKVISKYDHELLTIKLRYKKPREETSKLIVHTLRDTANGLAKTSDNFRWAASVAAFGMLLRESDHARNFTYDEVVSLAQSARGRDEDGFRAEFINMVKSFGLVSRK